MTYEKTKEPLIEHNTTIRTLRNSTVDQASRTQRAQNTKKTTTKTITANTITMKKKITATNEEMTIMTENKNTKKVLTETLMSTTTVQWYRQRITKKNTRMKQINTHSIRTNF